MSFVAAATKKIGFTTGFMILVALISDFLGLTGDRDLYTIVKSFIMSHWKFFLGISMGLIVGGATKNWMFGVIAAVIAIFILYVVVSP